MTDCIGFGVQSEESWAELFQYVSSGMFSHPKMRGGLTYTEDATPYSSHFRPANSFNLTALEELNVGWLDKYPSSMQLFFNWYATVADYPPIDEEFALWAIFDMIESAAYRAAVAPGGRTEEYLDPAAVMAMLRGAQVTGTFGLVRFNEKRLNIGVNALAVQVVGLGPDSDIVGPSTVATSPFVYPMPTWSERTYTWSLTDSEEERSAIAIASVCTVALLAIAATVLIYRNEAEIRMLHHWHIVSMCFAACMVCWGLVLLWQQDTRPWQCQNFLWVVFLPASYLIHLINIKAY
eukprot:gene10458-13419_t